ncbi:MAG: HU family DNA-binding protein [Victivallales bacterium]|nr:HU family DNA-binding protein [Victivallales bacterium]
MSNNTMTKRKIANAVASKIGITQSAAFDAVKATLETLSEILAAGGHVELRGFGVFEIITQKPRVGRNPNQPDIPVDIPARKVVKFRAGNELAEKVRSLPVK